MANDCLNPRPAKPITTDAHDSYELTWRIARDEKTGKMANLFTTRQTKDIPPQQMKTPEGEHSRQVRQEGVTVPSSSGDSVRSIAQPSAESQGGVRESRRVVDENGEPMVVYHGTNKYGFTVFDRRQERPYNALALRDGE